MKISIKYFLFLFVLSLALGNVSKVFAGNTVGTNVTSSGQTLTVSITSPADNSVAVVPPGETLIEGLVRIGAGGATSSKINVVYVVDVSGSTSSTGNDVNGDGVIDSQDDVNGDGRIGTVLDAEIAGIIALNNSLGNPTNVEVGIVKFNSGAQILDVSAAQGQQDFTTPQADLDGNGVNDIEEALKNLRSGGGTNFNSALSAMNSAFGNLNSSVLGVSFFLSDGFGSAPSTATIGTTNQLGVKVNTFAVGRGADSSPTGTLAKIASDTGGSFTVVTDPSGLSSALPTTQVVGITSVDINGSLVAISSIGTFMGNVTGFVEGVNTVTVKATADDGTVANATVDIVGVGQAVADFSADAPRGIAPHTVNFTNLSAGGVSTFAWDFGDVNPATSSDADPSHTYSLPGLYTVSLTASGEGGSATETKVDYIEVIPAPVVVADFDADVVEGPVALDVTFTDMSTSTESIRSHSWDFGDGEPGSTDQNPTHTYATPGMYTVELTIESGGVIDTASKSEFVTVRKGSGNILAEFEADPTAGFAPLGVNFVDLSVGNVTEWAWDFGDAGTSAEQFPIHTYLTAGIFTVTLTVSGPDGADTEVKTNLINVLSEGSPLVEFSADPTAGLAPLKVNFTDLSSGDVTSWAWDFGDAGVSSVQDPMNEYKSAGFFTVTLTASGSKGTGEEIKTNLIRVLPTPPVFAEFEADPTAGLAPLNVQFADLSGGDVTSWAWDFGDAGVSSDQNPVHEYKSDGFYTVTLTASGSSGADDEIKTNLIRVLPSSGQPIANFSASASAGFAPLNVKFTNLSSGEVSAFAWEFGDGGVSSDENPENEYKTEGFFTVGLTVSGPGGADTETKINLINVRSEGPPIAEFKGSPTSGLPPLAVTFTDLSQPSGNISSWAWDFGDGGISTSQNPSHDYNVEGLYTVGLTVSNSDGADTETKTNLINVGTVRPPVADFKASPTNGSPSLPVQFTDLSQPEGSIASWAWDFGDGGNSSEQSPLHTYNTDGFFTVTLTVSNDAGADTEKKTNLINVGAQSPPVADFKGSPTSGAAPLNVQFTDLSQPEGDIASWSWTFGDGGISSEQNPSHNYRTEGFFSVKLIVSNDAGSDTETKSNLIIVVAGEGTPVVDFSASPQAGQAPLEVKFTDLSQPEGSIASWLWTFGDGGTSSEQDPTHNYRKEGFFTVSLTASNSGGTDKETKTNLINVTTGGIVADFSASPLVGLAPLTVNFTDLSQPEGSIASWLWEFGDGGSATEQNPSHDYNIEGFYSVTLTVSNSDGASTEKKTNLINVQTGDVVADFSASPLVGQSPLEVNFTDLSQPEGGIDSWLWEFGDGGSSTDQDPLHSYNIAGFFSVGLTISNSDGADIEKKVNLIHVLSRPIIANFAASPTAGQAPLPVTFTDQSEPAGNIDSWLWDFGDGATETEQSPQHTYSNEGFFSVTLTVSNSDGANSERKTNLIFAKGRGVPTAEFSASPTAGEVPLTVEFDDESQGDVASWLWSFGDGATSDEQNPTHVYQTAGIFTVVLGVSGSGGADSEKKTNLIGVFDKGMVEAEFTAVPGIGIVPLTVEFTDNTAGEVDSWLWDFGDGGTSDVQNPMHDYVEPGDYTVSLTVSGPSNSDEEIKQNFIRVISDAEGSFAAFFDYEPVIGFSTESKPLEVQFYDQTQGVNVTPDSWTWDFGDGQTGNGETPLHEYSATAEQEFSVSLTVGVNGEEDTFLIADAVKVVPDTGVGCSAIMSIKPDPINLDGFRSVKANIALSSGCVGTVNDIICDSIVMAGASPTRCSVRRGSLVAQFAPSDLELESGTTVDVTLTGETTEGDKFTATDSVSVQ